MILSEEGAEEKPKKKRGRPKGAKSKPKVKSPKKESASVSSSKATLTTAEVAKLAEATAKAAEARSAAAKLAAEAAAKEEYEAAAAEAVASQADNLFTNKRGLDQIFRREMGEPEFWLEKNDRVPARPILSKDEEEAISRKVEIPTDQTPQYKPEHVLSPEFEGTSNYELGIKTQIDETEQRLTRLRGDPNSSAQEIKRAEEDLKTLDYLYENYHNGMNVFRTAKGGRSKPQK